MFWVNVEFYCLVNVMEDESYPLPRLMAIIKFKLQRPTNAVSHVTSDRFTVSVFKCLFLRTTASSYLFLVFKTWNVYKKVYFFKWCYLLNDSFAFIFHLNVHLLSSTFWHRLIYIYDINYDFNKPRLQTINVSWCSVCIHKIPPVANKIYI